MGFAAFESRMAAVGMKMLTNASAQINGGDPVNVIFDTESAEFFGAVKTTTHTIRYSADLVVQNNATVVINGETYRAVGSPDWISQSESIAHLVKL